MITRWTKISYTIFVAIFVPIYYQEYGISNFLWFSDIAVFITLIGIWLESSLLISMAALSIVFFELIWNLDFFINLLTGWHPLKLTQYMFEPTAHLLPRILSLFHIFLPALLLWLLYKIGYDKRALIWQSCFAWIVLIVCYFVTAPHKSINFVFGLGTPYHTIIPQPWYLILGMLLVATCIYLPSHIIFKKLFKRA